MSLAPTPVTLAEANAFVERHHRHHGPVVGHKFSIGCVHTDDLETIVGVVIVGRPVSRHLDDGTTLEATRNCTDGTPHVASFLYTRAWHVTKNLGYDRLITYTLAEEDGTSLKAADWEVKHETSGGSWSRPSRPRVDKHPTQRKLRWEKTG